jgi:hypothetical protein
MGRQGVRGADSYRSRLSYSDEVHRPGLPSLSPTAACGKLVLKYNGLPHPRKQPVADPPGVFLVAGQLGP